ncbi:hypothetical protein TNCV_4986031 [Trichonephila clavipes]|nr:hypothetical protein TNCV_4986031 [Trichonephila clavipes]
MGLEFFLLAAPFTSGVSNGHFYGLVSISALKNIHYWPHKMQNPEGKGWEKKINHDVKVGQIKETPHDKTGREDVPQKTKRSNEAERRRGGEERRKEDGTAEGCESRR